MKIIKENGDINFIEPFIRQELVPVIIQNDLTNKVLMLGYMNETALKESLSLQQVVFFSRKKNRLWKKGETSGNTLLIKEIYLDCDQDTLLIKVIPKGPTCHTGSESCFDLDIINPNFKNNGLFLFKLQEIIEERKLMFKNLELQNLVPESYTTSLFQKGINKISQKVGEEATELIIEAIQSNFNQELFLNEAADLLFHYLVLLSAKNLKLDDVINILKSREKRTIKQS